MSDFPVGISHDDDHVYTTNYPGEPLRHYTSITTALKALDKPALIYWNKGETAKAAVRNLDLLTRMVDEAGADAAIKFLLKPAEKKRDDRADVGTRVHKLIEAHAKKHEIQIADDAKPYMDAFFRFEDEWRPDYIATEYMVWHPVADYAGTGDLVVMILCPFHATYDRWRLDTKTMGVNDKGQRKGPYKEAALQLAAAHYAEFAGLAGDPKKYTVPRADHCGVLALVEDGTYALVPYDVTPATFEAFKNTLAAWNWLQGDAKTVIGQQLVPLAIERAA